MLTVQRLDQVAESADLKAQNWTLYEDGDEGDAASIVAGVMEQAAHLLREQ